MLTYMADSSMVTWVGDTLINLILTVVSLISISTGTDIIINLILKSNRLISLAVCVVASSQCIGLHSGMDLGHIR